MPTLPGREAYARQAIDCFRSQDYPAKELLIVTEKPEKFVDLEDDNICIIKAKEKEAAPKITQALHLMSGHLVMRWDDDDINFSHRIRSSVSEFMHSPAKAMGLKAGFFVTYSPRGFYYCPPLSDDWLHPSGIFWPDAWKERHDLRGVQFAPLQDITIMAVGVHPGNTVGKNGYLKYRMPLEVQLNVQ